MVLTSSVAALYGAPDERGVDHAFDEHDWGLVPKENVLPYFYSKKIAEQRAWEIHDKQSRWFLSCCCAPNQHLLRVAALGNGASV